MDLAIGTSLDRIIIIGYFALVMGFGAYFGRYSKTTTDYFWWEKICLVGNSNIHCSNWCWIAQFSKVLY